MFAPASVAVVGASERAGSYGGEVLLNLARLGYGGRVYAVNPRRDAVHGVRAYPELDELPEVPEAVVVAVPAAGAPDVVGRAAALGCGGGGRVRGRLRRGAPWRPAGAARGARRGRCRCAGRTATGSSRCPTASRCGATRSAPSQSGPVAVISQSGNVAVNALASRRGLGLHTVVSCGNQAVLDAADFLGAVAERDGVRSRRAVRRGRRRRRTLVRGARALRPRGRARRRAQSRARARRARPPRRPTRARSPATSASSGRCSRSAAPPGPRTRTTCSRSRRRSRQRRSRRRRPSRS